MTNAEERRARFEMWWSSQNRFVANKELAWIVSEACAAEYRELYIGADKRAEALKRRNDELQWLLERQGGAQGPSNVLREAYRAGQMDALAAVKEGQKPEESSVASDK